MTIKFKFEDIKDELNRFGETEVIPKALGAKLINHIFLFPVTSEFDERMYNVWHAPYIGFEVNDSTLFFSLEKILPHLFYEEKEAKEEPAKKSLWQKLKEKLG